MALPVNWSQGAWRHAQEPLPEHIIQRYRRYWVWSTTSAHDLLLDAIHPLSYQTPEAGKKRGIADSDDAQSI